MTNKKTCATDQIDTKEILSLVEMAVGQFASAAASFVDVAAIFEAIAAAAPSGSLMSRLANLGIGLCEQRECDFIEQQITYEAHVERFDDTLQQSTEASNG
ncbi:hypothetical protein G3N58_16140 [Paraburkholderia sp. Ac-20342]|uniref:hypothetical protein n=1 Tax=Paraburkholderia sp. Ac-20342 TaxID=2703889 RepID=UPI001980EAAE|nr:hypothetical protein [Paraburkholderia sp. Ac-20342]MBN3848348.1 hypothetical protein [Paraburkholderia sp. Ac-20342]